MDKKSRAEDLLVVSLMVGVIICLALFAYYVIIVPAGDYLEHSEKVKNVDYGIPGNWSLTKDLNMFDFSRQYYSEWYYFETEIYEKEKPYNTQEITLWYNKENNSGFYKIGWQ